MPAQLEEIVVDADRRDAEEPLPESSEDLLLPVAWRLVGGGELRPLVESLSRHRHRIGLQLEGDGRARGYGAAATDPIPLPLEGVGGQRHPAAALARVEAAPVDLSAGEPHLRLGGNGVLLRPQKAHRLLLSPSHYGSTHREGPPAHTERPGDIRERKLGVALQMVGEAF
jgi:hypothetical protein